MIRKSFTLPGKYNVRTKILTDSRFLQAGGGTQDDAIWKAGSGGGMIYLRKSRSPAQRYEDWKHEVDHALTDWKNYWFKPFKHGASND